MKDSHRISKIALKIAGLYALFGFLWILLSDKLLLILVRDIETVNMLQTYKGWFYVLVTALLVCLLINRYISDLTQSEQRYRLLLSNIADPIYLIDENGHTIDCNNAASQRLGYSREELLQLNFTEIDQNFDFDALIQQMGQSKTQNKLSLESTHKCKDNSFFPVEVSACVFDEGQKRFILGVARDITERKNTFEILVQNEKMNSLGNMAAGIAHEINNPLSAIMGACQNIQNRVFRDTPQNIEIANQSGIELDLLRDYINRREITRMLESILTAGERASKIVTSMLNFSYSNPVKMHSCRLTGLLDETLELISADFNLIRNYDFKQIRIKKEYPDTDRPVCCIRSALQQVFLNLLKNATEAMAEKNYSESENPELTVRIKNEGKKVVIEMHDNGPGMDEEVQKRIFDPFYTSKEVGKGTGLGLSVSYFIVVDQHKGTMEVQSSPQEGTCFRITLPEDACDCCAI